jgi:hypothetical protein
MRSRMIGVLASVALVGGAAAVLDTVSQARGQLVAVASASKLKSHESGIQLTSSTITIPKSQVKKELAGVSASGIFKFKHATSPLTKLKPGKIMLLQGSDAEMVTKVSHSHGDLLVSTKTASLGQLIKKGTITFSGAPGFQNVFLAPTIASPTSSKTANDFARPTYPYVGRPPGTVIATAAGAPSVSAQGSAGAFGYSLTFTPASSTKLDISGVLCFQWGSICSNGPSNGLSLEANISGYIDVGNEKVGISVNGGAVTHSSINLNNLDAHLKITWTAARGTGPDSGGDPPVFHVPIGVDYTIPGEIPIYVKLQTALLVKLGISAKNSVMGGGVNLTSDGSATLNESGHSVSGTDPSGTIGGGFITPGSSGVHANSTLGASGLVLAVQFPKFGAGLGFRSANAIGYVDMITSLGQVTGSEVAGEFCSGYELDFSVGGGLEAQFGPFGVSSPRKILWPTDGKQKQEKYNVGAGCPTL